MLKAFSALVFKLLASVGLGFMLRQGGKTSERLDNAKDTIKGVEKRDAIRDQVRRDGADAARKRMQERNG